MKKKIISLSLVMVMLMGLSACGNKPTTDTSSKAAETSAAKSAEESSSSDAEPSADNSDELKDYNRVTVVEMDKMYINYHKKHHPNNFSHGFYYEDRTAKKGSAFRYLLHMMTKYSASRLQVN